MKKISTLLLLSAFAAPAWAADSGPYIGLTLGASKVSNHIGAIVPSKSSDTVYGVLAGYQFSKNIALEAHYTGAGNFEAVPTMGKNDAYCLSVLGLLPLSDAFSLYGKLGYSLTRTRLSANALPATGANRSSATYGLGTQYNVNPTIGLRLGWDRYSSTIKNAANLNQDFDSDVWSVAAIYKF